MKKTMTILVSLLFVATTASYGLLTVYHHQLYERFPEFDRKIIRKAYRNMWVNALLQKYPEEVMDDDAKMDVVFAHECYKILYPQS